MTRACNGENQLGGAKEPTTQTAALTIFHGDLQCDVVSAWS
jgi:hypothetical protein